VFTKAMFVPGGERRVENGTRGTVLQASSKDNQLLVQTEGANPREVSVNTEQHKDLRLGYAQHVYKAQGLTVDRAHTMIGGWQTDRERAYVAVSRSREQTDIYAAREDLGEQGMDTGAIERLGETIAESHAQQPSIATPAATPAAAARAREHQPAQHAEQTPTALLAADSATTTGPSTYERDTLSERESEAASIMYESQEQQDRGQDHDRDLGYRIE
jgi:hypothetical protein